MKTTGKAAITPYLALTLTVLLSLILVCLHSARYACGRTVLAAGMDEGLFSLFSEYDRTLYHRYGLLFIDSGFGESTPDYGRMLEEVEEITETVARPEGGILSLSGRNLYDIRVKHRAVTGVVTATDGQYAPLKSQIYTLMAKKTGVDVLCAAYDCLTGDAGSVAAQEEGGSPDLDALQQEYAREKEEAREKGETLPANPASGQPAVPPDFKNPIDHISSLRKLGIYSFILPAGTALSGASLVKKDLLSARTKNEGFGIGFPYEEKFAQKYLFIEYLLDFFPCFLSERTEEGLQYQVEYAVAGKMTDTAGLKSVLNRLMLIREGFNFLFLNTDAARRAEAYDMALLISILLAIPGAVTLVAELLMLCWAYGESLLDMKALLAGKKIPLFKDKDTWQLSLTNLSSLAADEDAPGSGRGLTYRDYLRILLLLKPENQLLERIADLLEYNRRLLDKEPEFRLDNCVFVFEAELSGTVSGREFTIKRNFGYDS